jgi:hypothetical protein
VPVLAVLGARLALQGVIFGKGMARLNEKDLLIFTPVFDAAVAFIYTILAICNAFSKVKEWK